MEPRLRPRNGKAPRPALQKKLVLHPDKPDFVHHRLPGGWMAIPLTPAVKRTTLTGVRCDEPGIIRPAGEGLAGQAGGLFSLFVLHRAGFVLPPFLRSGRWALNPPFHPYRMWTRASPGERENPGPHPAVYFL